MWTVEKVKNELPTIKGQYQGKVYNCKVTGRRNAFASVTPYNQHANFLGPTYDVAWSVLANCLNDNRTVILD